MPSKNWRIQTRLHVREGSPRHKIRNCLEIIKGRKTNWSRVWDECLTSRQTGRLIVGRNITWLYRQTIHSTVVSIGTECSEYLRTVPFTLVYHCFKWSQKIGRLFLIKPFKLLNDTDSILGLLYFLWLCYIDSVSEVHAASTFIIEVFRLVSSFRFTKGTGDKLRLALHSSTLKMKVACTSETTETTKTQNRHQQTILTSSW
jgi:hypothetical protein